MKKNLDPIDVAKRAAEEFRACYGQDLVSVILFGSAAGKDIIPGKSDSNLLVIVKTMTIAEIEKSEKIQTALLKSRFSRPLFMDEDYVTRSLDSFPVEFLNMKENHSVLFGLDILNSLVINKTDLRLQVERELKGKWLHLMGSWLRLKNNRKELYEFYRVSLSEFSALFRALLFLKDIVVPEDSQEIFNAVYTAYGLKEHPFNEIVAAFKTKDSGALKMNYFNYSRAIRDITISIE